MRKPIDRVNYKNGKLTVIKMHGRAKDGNTLWWCRCDCGKEKAIRSDKITKTKSCGCLRSKLRDLTGQQFGELKVLNFDHYSKPGKHGSKWKCLCSCGKIVCVLGSNLTRGNSKSCGCSRTLDYQIGFKGASCRQQILNGYKKHSKEYNREWNISDELAFELFDKPCHYCGIEFSNERYIISKNIVYRYNGIDRVNNDIGYIEGNVVTCCKKCNFAKGSMGYLEFIDWGIRLGKKLIGENQ